MTALRALAALPWLAAVGVGLAGAAASETPATATTPLMATTPTTPTPLAQPASDDARALVATVEQPRPFGHVLGDVLRQRVLLAHEGRALVPAALPTADRVGLYFERRPVRLERDDQGRSWLVLEYQLVNAPTSLQALTLPPVAIETGAGRLQVPAWPVSVGPLTPDTTFDQGGLQPLRPDRPVEPRATEALERGLVRALGVLAAVLLAWAAWWAGRNWRESCRLPFARAWRRLQRLEADGGHRTDGEDAWLVLHEALNAAAGRVVHGRSLPALLAESPQWQPLAPQLAAFFRHSEQRFFATAAGLAPDTRAVHALARALRDAERRHHA